MRYAMTIRALLTRIGSNGQEDFSRQSRSNLLDCGYNLGTDQGAVATTQYQPLATRLSCSTCTAFTRLGSTSAGASQLSPLLPSCCATGGFQRPPSTPRLQVHFVCLRRFISSQASRRSRYLNTTQLSRGSLIILAPHARRWVLSDIIVLQSLPLLIHTWKDRYLSFLHMIRQWRHLKMLKRAGQGNVPNGATAVPPGSCAVECPACPHPGRNLPGDWQTAPASRR